MGLQKHFFYPGFSTATGGLLREQDLALRQQEFDPKRWLSQWAQTQGKVHAKRWVSLFCYEPCALRFLLSQLAQAESPVGLLVTAGRATAAVQAAMAQDTSLQVAESSGALHITYLPLLTQEDFDHLLWSCDLNFVRGEDSWVRALWAGKPFVWQAYPQQDGAHHQKMDAFLNRLEASPDLRQWHAAWNVTTCELAPPAINTLWNDPACRRLRENLLQQGDLCQQLMHFATRWQSNGIRVKEKNR